MIEALGLSKFYGVFAAARDVTFTVRKGELVAFLGPNGAGKSTTMKMLTGYLAPSLGTARIAGHDMSTDRLAGSSRLGYLPENGPLYPDETPHSLLEFFADARGMDRLVQEGADRRGDRFVCPGQRHSRRSASSRKAFASAWAWPTPCCTSRTC